MKMKLRGIEFGNILGASGVQGFLGEGYWFHRLFKWFGCDFDGMTFVSKTATFQSRQGNMLLDAWNRPVHFFPSCVKVKFWQGLMLNAVGLSNPCLGVLLEQGSWQQRTKPFMISIASVANSAKERLVELSFMVEILRMRKKEFKAPFGLQINLSCPNTGHKPSEIIRESERVLEIASSLGVPVMPKFSIASAPIEAVMELDKNPNCDAICVSNTIPFGWNGVSWKDMWGSDVSPLADLGGGGLSGKRIMPYVLDWIVRLRGKGFTKAINGGGGIFCPADVGFYKNAGASSVFLGSVASLRPWRVQRIIRHANSLAW